MSCPCGAPLSGAHQRWKAAQGPMPLVAGGAVTFFVRATLVTLLTVRLVLVLVLEEVSLSVAFVSLFLGLG